MRIYYDNTDLDKNVSQIVVLYADSMDGNYIDIASITYNPSQDYLEFSAPENFDSKWFKLRLLDSKATVLGTTDAFVSGYYGKLIEDTRTNLGDLDAENPAFETSEYYIKIREAMMIHYGDPDTPIKDGDLSFLLLLIMESCCYNLAYDNARYSRITLPDGISLDKGERVEHYLSIAKSLRERYDYYMNSSNTGQGGVHIGKINANKYFNRSYMR
jgi:hypothetical protein